MAKRIYSETVKKWLIGSGITAGTLISGIFLYMTFLGAITITGYSGDSICAGTIEDSCYAYINFTANEDIFIYPTNYDPWGRDTFMQFDPAVKSWKLQRSWGSGWRDIPLNETCTGTWCGAPNNKGVKYSYVLREGRDYNFRVIGYKKDPKETIKWSVNYEDKEYLDPIWEGIFSNYTIEGETIFVNDSKVFISATPYNISSGWVDFNITSKIYEGDVDLVMLFDTNYTKPVAAQYYSPHVVSLNRSYTCNDYFNISGGHFWCYDTLQDENNNTYYQLNFDHDFDSGNVQERTAYWSEDIVSGYRDVPKIFNSRAINYQGMNRAYYVKDFPMIQGQDYAFRIRIKQMVFDSGNHKYWFAIKPSHLSIEEAIAQNAFYALDPWTSSLAEDVYIYHQFNETTTGTLLDAENNNNLTTYNMENADLLGPGIKFGQHPDGTDEYTKSDLTYTGGYDGDDNYTVCAWFNATGLGSIIVKDSQGIGARYPWNLIVRGGGGGSKLGWDQYDGSFGFSLSSGLAVNNNTWIHGCGRVIAGVNATLFVGGVPVASDTSPDNTPQTANLSHYLNRGNGGSLYLDGGSDEVVIWFRALSDSEISDVYNSGNGITWTDTSAPADTCTCPGATNNWEVNMEDNCNLISACTLTTGNLSWIGSSGYFNCSANLNLTNRDAPPSATTFYFSSGCDLIRLIILVLLMPATMFKRKRSLKLTWK